MKYLSLSLSLSGVRNIIRLLGLCALRQRPGVVGRESNAELLSLNNGFSGELRCGRVALTKYDFSGNPGNRPGVSGKPEFLENPPRRAGVGLSGKRKCCQVALTKYGISWNLACSRVALTK